MAKRWKKAELGELEKVAATQTVEELANRFELEEAAMRKKLSDLGLIARTGRMNDPSLAVYEKGIKALYKKQWQNAAKHFEQVVAQTDQRDLAERSRRFLEVCGENLKEAKAGDDDDPFLLAVVERNLGNLDEALAMCARGGRQNKDERFAFLAASIYSLQGDFDKAVGLLSTAIEQNPKNRILAFVDSDFDELRESPEHTHIFD